MTGRYQFDFSISNKKYISDVLTGKTVRENDSLKNALDDEKRSLIANRNIENYKDRPHLYLKILTTYNCNCDCIYCYEKNKFTEYEHKTHVMSEACIESIYDFICRYINDNNIEEVTLSWYGGEPLLNLNPIKYLNPKIMGLPGIKFFSDITSNGVLLTEQVAKELKKYGVMSASITVDGKKNNHDNARPLKYSNESAFDIIMSNIHNAVKYMHINVIYIMRKNNVNDIGDIIDYISQYKNISFFAGRMENISDCLENDNDVLDYYTFTKIRTKAYIYALTKKVIVWPNTVTGLGGLCYARTRHGYTISPNGDVYKCVDSITDTKYKIGKIQQNGCFYKDNEDVLISVKQNDCEGCVLYPLCAGGCVYEFLESGERRCPMEIYNGKPQDVDHFREVLYASSLSNMMMEKLKFIDED